MKFVNAVCYGNRNLSGLCRRFTFKPFLTHDDYLKFLVRFYVLGLHTLIYTYILPRLVHNPGTSLL